MTQATTTPDRDAERNTLFTSLGSLEVGATFHLAWPHKEMRDTFTKLNANPSTGPRYAGGDERYGWKGRISGQAPQRDELAFCFNAHRVLQGITELHQELKTAAADPVLLALTRAAGRDAHDDGRLASFNRTHDLSEFADAVGQSVEWLDSYRMDRDRINLSRKSQALHGPALSVVDLRPLTDLRLDYGPPKWQVQGLTRAAILRWWPAVQNIISRLPQREQRAAAGRAETRLTNHLLTLAKLSTLCRTTTDEYKRWESGFGAVDQAILESVCMVSYAKDLADRMETGTGTDVLRSSTKASLGEALKALDELACGRFSTLRHDAWRNHKGDLVQFARQTGGIAPTLEVMCHARGSSFLGH